MVTNTTEVGGATPTSLVRTLGEALRTAVKFMESREGSTDADFDQLDDALDAYDEWQDEPSDGVAEMLSLAMEPWGIVATGTGTAMLLTAEDPLALIALADHIVDATIVTMVTNLNEGGAS